MKTKNSNTNNLIGIAIKENNYKFVELQKLQNENFGTVLKSKYNTADKINKLIDKQTNKLYDCTHLSVAPFYDLTDKQFIDRQKYYDIEEGIKVFKSLDQLFKFSFVNMLFLFENNKWYTEDTFTMRYYLNYKKIESISINDLKEV